MRALTLAVILISGLLVVTVGEALAVEQGFSIQWNETETSIGHGVKEAGKAVGHGIKVAGKTAYKGGKAVGNGAKTAGKAVGRWIFGGEPEDKPVLWDYPGQEPKRGPVKSVIVYEL